MKKFKAIPRWPLLVTLFVVFVLLTIALPGAAQENPLPPPRNIDPTAGRPAPDREAVILEQQVLENGINTVVEIPAEADTYLASEYPDQNFGAESLYLGYNLEGSQPYGAERILLRFDIAGYIPDNATINSGLVRLRLAYSNPVNDQAMGTALRRLASPWNEYTVTWNTEPVWAPINKITYVGSALTWYEWNITDVVAGWAANDYPNDGVEIIGDETVQQRERAFYSRETDTVYHPRLVVDYTVNEDNEAPIVTVDPLPPFVPQHFTVSWSGTDPGPSEIDYYDVQVRIDDEEWQPWLSGVTITETQYTDGENGRLYQFRARGVDEAGNVEVFGAAEAETTVDTLPPTSTVNPLPHITNETSFTVSWSGTDSGSGIQYYDVQYRFNNSSWVLWLPQTLATSAVFTNASDGIYAFEVRAVDNLGHVEAFMDVAEASIVIDHVPPFVVPQVWMPAVFDQP